MTLKMIDKEVIEIKSDNKLNWAAFFIFGGLSK